MSAYERVKGGKLSFKGGTGVEKLIQKNSKKKKAKKSKMPEEQEEDRDKVDGLNSEEEAEVDGKRPFPAKKAATAYEIDTGTGFAPDGKKSKHYEELFPVETKRVGYVVTQVPSREAALDERVKRKADRYCK